MTNDEFRQWKERHFRSDFACAKALEIDRETVAALSSGKTRRGTPYPVRAHIALACAGWTIGARDYHGGPVTVGG